jgi:hypothetical protein
MIKGSPGSLTGAMRERIPGRSGASLHSTPQTPPIEGTWADAAPRTSSEAVAAIDRIE